MACSHPLCVQDGVNLEQVNALAKEGPLNSDLCLTITWSKGRAIAVGNTQLRHFHAKFRLSGIELNERVPAGGDGSTE